MVPGTGIEPVRTKAADFKSATSTNFVTRANPLESGFYLNFVFVSAMSELKHQFLESGQSSSVLTLLVTEAGVEVDRTPDPRWDIPVDLGDIRAWRFFNASPKEFFRQYRKGFLIEHIHLFKNVLMEALQYLLEDPDAVLILSGHVSEQQIAMGQSFCSQHRIKLNIIRRGLPRAMFIESFDDSFSLKWQSTPEQALPRAGMLDQSKYPTVYWTQWFNRFLAEDVYPVLRIRDRGQFFHFMKVLAQRTALGLNWSEIGAEIGASGPCVRDWTGFLMECGVIRLVEALRAPAPRRSKLRPKLYWNAPGLAVWLGDSINEVEAGFLPKLIENAVYLALIDSFEDARFYHFIDTNYVCAPLIMERNHVRTAIYFADAPEQRQKATRHHDSLVKASICNKGVVLAAPLPETEKRDTHELQIIGLSC